MAILNFQYRLLPTTAQAELLSQGMAGIGAGWNRLVRKTEKAMRIIRKGQAGRIQKRLVALVISKRFSGVRAAKVIAAQASGATKEEAQKEVLSGAIAKARTFKRSRLAIEYAMEHVQAKKRAQNGSALGGAWVALSRKYRDSWEACWKGTRGAPRKAKIRYAGWLSAQLATLPAKGFFVYAEPRTAKKFNKVDLSRFFPDRFSKLPERIKKAPASRREALKKEFYALSQVELIEHRPLPPDGILRECKVTRRGIGEHATWFLTLAVEVTEEYARKVYPVTGKACGINPSRRYAFTLCGEDHLRRGEAPGIAGEDIGRIRLLEKSQRKLARLQRKLDRQRRANNPECFDAKGVWIKGKRANNFSKNMLETEREIRETHSHIANQRLEIYRETADWLLNRYDVIYLGDWKDASPQERKRKKDKAKEQVPGEIKKGEAMLEKLGNKMDRDNALGIFRQVMKEKTSRTNGEKSVIVIEEPFTTVPCAMCGELTGPTSIRQQGFWTCTKCKHKQLRGRTAAYNILQRGLRLSLEMTSGESQKAEGFSVKGANTTVGPAPKGKGAKASCRAREAKASPLSPLRGGSPKTP